MTGEKHSTTQHNVADDLQNRGKNDVRCLRQR